MTRGEFFLQIEPHRAELQAMVVERIGVFGSVARNDARPDSDVDVLVDLREGVDLIDFVGIKTRLEEILGSRVDLVSSRGLKRSRMQERVLRDVRYAA
jgi:predicted nucleotidyltransferase